MNGGRHDPAAHGRLPSVLVVDDVKQNLTAMEATLGTLACEVVLASSGNEALRALLRGNFAVMLLDIQMPQMDGYEVARLARDNPATRDVPIIFLTAAHRDQAHVLRGYGSGAVDFLFKPADSTVLQSKVRVFLELYTKRREITDAKQALERAYAELKTTQAQLIQTAKMASLGELVAGVAHEINNPLSFCLAHVQTARADVAELSAPDASEHDSAFHRERALNRLDETAGGLQRIQEIVKHLRTFSRVDVGERTLASIPEGIESVLLMLQHRLRDRIRVETNFEGPSRVECAPSLLNQAVMNLVANAIEAIEGPGSIRISTGLRGNDYIITVADDGPGIPVEIRERVLEPFFTTKPIGRGTGLGLAITYSIATSHKGTLHLDTGSNGGTVATLSFPVEG